MEVPVVATPRDAGPTEAPLTRSERRGMLFQACILVWAYSFGFFAFFHPTDHPLAWAKPVFVVIYIVLPIWIWPAVYGMFAAGLAEEPQPAA